MFMDQAKRDANDVALKSFFWANEAEKTLGRFYETALNVIKHGEDLALREPHICSVCGYAVEGDPPDQCPTCGQSKDKFKLVE